MPICMPAIVRTFILRVTMTNTMLQDMDEEDLRGYLNLNSLPLSCKIAILSSPPLG
jgi:hypothetical protein